MSRVVAVAIIVAVPVMCANCSSMVFAVMNAPAYVGPYERHADIQYGTAPRQSLDVYVPAAALYRPVVVFWYGGMWVKGSKEQYRFVGAALANAGYVAVLPDYRLYPQARFPQFIEDGASAVRWVREHAAEFGGDPRAVFLMGHSAGAHIAASLALNERYLKNVGGDTSWVRGWIGLSGPYELEMRTPLLRAIFPIPYMPADWQPASLVNGHSPAALILHGQNDYLVHPIEAVNLDLKLRAAGVPVECRIYDNGAHSATVGAFSLLLRSDAPSLADVRHFIDRTMTDSATGREPQAGAPCPDLPHRWPWSDRKPVVITQ